jgi:sulfofructose kinase
VTAISDIAPTAGQIRIICLGLSAQDQVWRVERFFSEHSEKIRSTDYTTLGGGQRRRNRCGARRRHFLLGPRRR